MNQQINQPVSQPPMGQPVEKSSSKVGYIIGIIILVIIAIIALWYSSAKFIVTGDITQVDLPKQQVSGLIHVQSVLNDIPGIDFIYLDNSDIIRHKLVSRIINAYGKKS